MVLLIRSIAKYFLFLVFVVLIIGLFRYSISSLPITHTLRRNVTIARMLIYMAQLMNDQSFVKGMQPRPGMEIDEKTVAEYDVRDVQLEKEYFAKQTSQPSERNIPLNDCLNEFQKKLYENGNSKQLYFNWWNRCITSRTRVADDADDK